jgi:hypothetical protein
MNLEPGANAYLLFSQYLASSPTSILGIGQLALDRPTTRAIPLGVVPSDGKLTTVQSLPTDPFFLGSTFFYQGMTQCPDSLTADWVALTIVP